MDDEVAQSACALAREIKKEIFDDEQFQGLNWHPTEGITVTDGTDGGSQDPAALGAGTGDFSVTAEHPARTSVHGVKFTDSTVTDQANRMVELTFRNAYLRYLSIYVQFANEGRDLPVEFPTKQDTFRAKFLKWTHSNYTVLGIPLIGDDIPSSSVCFNVPSEASKAKVYFGSLGLAGEAVSPEAVPGAELTLIFDIGLPTMFLAAGVAIGIEVATINNEVSDHPE